MNLARNTIALEKLPRLTRGASALCAAAFLLFLIYSAPHRVHHVFEQIEAASHEDAHDHHGGSKRQNSSPNHSDCAFQASANRCTIGLTALVHLSTPTWLVQRLFAFQEKSDFKQLLAAAFPIRAPPRS